VRITRIEQARAHRPPPERFFLALETHDETGHHDTVDMIEEREQHALTKREETRHGLPVEPAEVPDDALDALHVTRRKHSHDFIQHPTIASVTRATSS